MTWVSLIPILRQPIPTSTDCSLAQRCQDERPDLHKLLNNTADETIIHAEPDDAFHRLVKIIVEAQQDGLFKPSDPILLATTIWSLLHGLSMLAIDGHLSVVGNVEAIYEANYKVLLEGVLIAQG